MRMKLKTKGGLVVDPEAIRDEWEAWEEAVAKLQELERDYKKAMNAAKISRDNVLDAKIDLAARDVALLDIPPHLRSAMRTWLDGRPVEADLIQWRETDD